jgi:hypothetical protein
MKNQTDEKYNTLAYYTFSLQDENFIHQHVVDANTVANADKHTKLISLTFALVRLYLFVEKAFTGKEVQQFHTLMSNNKTAWPTIRLAVPNETINIDMVLNTDAGIERNAMIEIWCIHVWNNNQINHAAIKALTLNYLPLCKNYANKPKR